MRSFSSLIAKYTSSLLFKKKCVYCYRIIERGETYIKLNYMNGSETWCTDCGSIDENK